MKTKRYEEIADTIIWNIIYSLPLVIYIIGNIRNDLTLSNTMLQMAVNDNNIILTMFNEIFANEEYLQLFETNSAILVYLSYFCNMYYIHLIVDIIVALPRYCHKLINKM